MADGPPSSAIPVGTVAEMAGRVVWERCTWPGGTAHAKTAFTHVPLLWCACPVCWSVDLYGYENAGCLCPWCNHEGAAPGGAVMAPLRGQEAACTTFLVGGLDAVSTLAKAEVSTG